ncbi:MAG: (d)CMP kinase [Armatimonadetes bacterium]|nr:(d)CMP kinase [Armatimonadota bacterium]
MQRKSCISGEYARPALHIGGVIDSKVLDFEPPPHWRVALDGPAAGGKTTVARRVAQALGYALIDTGAMYRAVALGALERGLSTGDRAAMERLAEAEASRSEFLPDLEGSQGFRLLVGGVDVTGRLHEPRVSQVVPAVAAIPGVRRVLAAQQAAIGRRGGVVMTGRDIGTVVIPDAEVKVFLTASPEERARRRYGDMHARGEAGDETPEVLQQIEQTLRERDLQDSSRDDSPLLQAPDAVLLDSTGLSLDEVVARIIDLVRTRMRTEVR